MTGSYSTDCADCGSSISAASRFCPVCGERQSWFSDGE